MYKGSLKTHSFGDVYSFIRDRTRQVTQELIVQSATDLPAVKATEEICRFLILSINEGEGFDSFNHVQNMELLTHNLSRLQQMYDSFSPEELPNLAEFTAYSLITSDPCRAL
jgi:hypothetical protein